MSVVLIGLPGSGKSTLGVLLAKRLGWDFCDTDLVLQNAAGRTLDAILRDEGYLALRAREEAALLALDNQARRVLATGGSAVYSLAGMSRLKTFGPVVWLRARLDTLRSRVTRWDDRGLAAPPGTSLEALAAERQPLYERWADWALDVDEASQEDLAAALAERLTRDPPRA